MNLRMKKVTALLLTGMVLASVAACGETQNETPDSGQVTSQETENSADGLFSSMDTTDLEGNAMDSSVFAENKVTVVNVWNVGCTPCIQEIPILDQLNKEYEGKGVAIKGMYYNFGKEVSESDKAEIDEILTRAGAEYPQIVLSQEMYESEEISNIQAFPTTYFVDSKGSIFEKLEGSDDYDGWKAEIEKALEKVEE